jgi:hypothetical protein
MQRLIDQGWARSGGWLYHPTNSRTCCPNYAVCLAVLLSCYLSLVFVRFAIHTLTLIYR